MHPIDYAIIVAYLLGLVIIGLVLARRAARGADDYFLGGRHIPWWALGASGMASNLDVAGTIVIISFIYTYGLQGFFIEMRGGVVLPIAIWLAFMGKWHRRSNVTTTAEWMELRFGRGLQGRLARYAAALTYLVITVGMVTFFLVAAGKFLADFTPGVPTSTEIHALEGELAAMSAGEPAHDSMARELHEMRQQRAGAVVWLSAGMAVVALVYTMLSGLYGVVWTDVFQAFIIGGAAIFVGYTAFKLVSPDLLSNWPGHQLGLNVPWPRMTVPNPPADLGTNEPYHLFWIFALFFAGKGILEGLGGSGGSAYMAQRYYAAHSDADTRRLSMLWALLFAFRWPMVVGFCVIAVHLGIGRQDPERILSAVLLNDEFFPAGFRGLAVAAVLAASMSTFDSTINAGASYVVKDLYVPLAAGRASAVDEPGPENEAGVSERAQVIVGYFASFAIVALGLMIALLIPQEGVTFVWVTIVVQLFPAFLVPFALRWFWGRFNGIGFCLGIGFGFAASLFVTLVGTGMNEWQIIALVTGVSFVGSCLGTFLAPATAPDTLRAFYTRIRPFGLWPREWRQGDRAEHTRDALRLVAALFWQLMTFLLPMLLVMKLWGYLTAVFLPWVVLTILLWLDARSAPGDEAASETLPA